jgi:hypothetical protein
MPTTITETGLWATTLHVPSDGEDAEEAGLLSTFAEGLANRTHYLKDRLDTGVLRIRSGTLTQMLADTTHTVGELWLVTGSSERYGLYRFDTSGGGGATQAPGIYMVSGGYWIHILWDYTGFAAVDLTTNILTDLATPRHLRANIQTGPNSTATLSLTGGDIVFLPDTLSGDHVWTLPEGQIGDRVEISGELTNYNAHYVDVKNEATQTLTRVYPPQVISAGVTTSCIIRYTSEGWRVVHKCVRHNASSY